MRSGADLVGNGHRRSEGPVAAWLLQQNHGQNDR